MTEQWSWASPPAVTADLLNYFGEEAPKVAAMARCKTCGDLLEDGECKRCDWGEPMGWNTDNPIDPTQAVKPGIQASSDDDLSFSDRLDMVPGAKRITEIPNQLEHFVGDRVVNHYNSIDEEGRNLNAGTVVEKHPPGNYWVYEGDRADYGHGSGNGFPKTVTQPSYHVRWDYRAHPRTFELSAPGEVGEHVGQSELHPEGSPYLDMALEGGLDPDRRYDLDDEHFSRTIPQHRWS